MSIKFTSATYIKDASAIVAVNISVIHDNGTDARPFIFQMPVAAKFPDKPTALAAVHQFIIDNNLISAFIQNRADLSAPSVDVVGAGETL